MGFCATVARPGPVIIGCIVLVAGFGIGTAATQDSPWLTNFTLVNKVDGMEGPQCTASLPLSYEDSVSVSKTFIQGRQTYWPPETNTPFVPDQFRIDRPSMNGNPGKATESAEKESWVGNTNEHNGPFDSGTWTVTVSAPPSGSSGDGQSRCKIYNGRVRLNFRHG